MGRKSGCSQETGTQSPDRAGICRTSSEPSAIRYQHTAKTEILFAQLCVGISGGGIAAIAVLTDYIIAKRATMQPSATTKAPVIAVILRRRACPAILFRLSSIVWC